MGQIHRQLEELIIFALRDYASSVQRTVDESWNAGLTHPQDIQYGDYACNVAMKYAAYFDITPRDLAERLVAILEKNKLAALARISIEGPGFINFVLRDEYFFE